MEKKVEDYGKWQSPISVEILASAKKISDILWDDHTKSVFWSETFNKKVKIFSYGLLDQKISRHKKIKKIGGSIGYGGGGWSSANQFLFYAESGRLYCYDHKTKTSRKILTRNGGIASPLLSPCGDWVAYIHQSEDEFDCVGIVDAEGKEWPLKLTEGCDFYTQFRWSPNGKQVAFVGWNHPYMPWINSQVYLADFIVEHGRPRLKNIRVVSSKEEQAVFQPEFSRCGQSLYYMSDISGWSQLYRFDFKSSKIISCGQIDGECAQPNWVQNMRTWSLSYDEAYAFVVANKNSSMRLYQIELKTMKTTLVESLSEWTEYNQILGSKTSSHLSLMVTAPDQATKVIIYDYKKKESTVVVNSAPEIESDYFSKPKIMHWKTKDQTPITGVYWPPNNKDYKGPENQKPPVIVKAHVGPTAQCRVNWDLDIQLYTSRGFGFFAINFRGSTGFGREFMKKLNGNYGIYDVQDVVSGAEYLVSEGLADPTRLVIMGSSSGGYTVFQAMTDYPEAFAGGISAYGITDLLALGANTHKFEKHYNDCLVATLPEGRKILKERSPINKVKNVKRPLAVFQGSEDLVVTPDQAENFVNALREQGSQVTYYLYEGEGHGFRRLETREHYYQSVIDFIHEIID